MQETAVRHRLDATLEKANSSDLSNFLNRVREIPTGELFQEAFTNNTDPESLLMHLSEVPTGVSHLVGKLKNEASLEGSMLLVINRHIRFTPNATTPNRFDLNLIVYSTGIETIPDESWGSLQADPLISIWSRIRDYHIDQLYPHIGRGDFNNDRLLLMDFPERSRLITPALSWVTNFAAEFNRKATSK